MVAQTAAAAPGHNELIAFVAEVGKLLAAMFRLSDRPRGPEHYRPDRHGHDDVLAALAVAVATLAVLAVHGTAMRNVAKIKQTRLVGGCPEDDGSAAAAVAAVRPGQWLVLLTPDRRSAVAAVSALEMHGDTIYEVRHP